MGKLTLVLVAVVVTAVGAGVRHLTSDDSAAACSRDFAAGFKDSMSSELRPFVDDTQLAAEVEQTCLQLAFADEAEFRELAVTRPDLYSPLCRVVVDAELKAYARDMRFLTAAERERYPRQHCLLAPKYFAPGTTQVDWDALVADHSEIYAPLCASSMQAEMAGEPELAAAFSPGELAKITRASCAEALETGTIDCGAKGLTDATLDEARFEEIFVRHAEAVAEA